jgi:hypothetical protein
MKRTHWGQHGPECGPCRWQTVSISAEATPGRRPEAVFHANREREWARATSKLEIESGGVVK